MIKLLAQVMDQVQIQPVVLVPDMDRWPCCMDAEGGGRSPLPGRLPLWLWGLGIHHRLLPPGQPCRIGAVERSWTGEDDGLSARVTGWNVGKPDAAAVAPPAVGRGMASVWRVSGRNWSRPG